MCESDLTSPIFFSKYSNLCLLFQLFSKGNTHVGHIYRARHILSVSFYHGLESFDVPFMTEAGTYIVVLSYMYLMMACTKLHLTDYRNMQRAIHEDFLFFCTTGDKYRYRNKWQNKVKNTHNLTEIKILRNKMVEKVIKSIEKQKSSQYFNFLIPIWKSYEVICLHSVELWKLVVNYF